MPDNSPTPSPALWHLMLDFSSLRGDRIAMLKACFDRHGRSFKLQLPFSPPTWFISDPVDIKHMLVINQDNYHKTGAYRIGSDLFGSGLLSSDGDLHKQQRRTLQPMFVQKKIATLGGAVERSIKDLLTRWDDLDVVDLSKEMMRLSVGIAGRAMFNFDLSEHSQRINHAFTIAQRHVAFLDAIWLRLPHFMMVRRVERYKAAVAQLRQIVEEIIQHGERREDRPEDVLTILGRAKDRSGCPLDGAQIRDEVLTIMLAAHETTANILTWGFYRLSQSPEIEAKLLAELREVLDGRPATIEDMPKLVYTRMVFSEMLRLYPPVWILGRETVADDRLPSGVEIPAGVPVASLPYLVHRNPEYFPDPEIFDPERFNPDNSQERPQFAYYPFGGGARTCIGESFARMEATLILATLAQMYRFIPEPDQRIEPEPLLTYRLKNGLRMRLERRRSTVRPKARAIPGALASQRHCPFSGNVGQAGAEVADIRDSQSAA